MKKFFLLSVAATLISSISFANIRRVGFFGPAVIGVDYGTLQQAHDASTTGDTIMMMPGTSVQGTITKPLVIIGPGFFLNPSDFVYPGNAGLQANTNSNESPSGLTFSAGSSNTQVIGCSMYSTSFITAGLTNILFKRCFIGRLAFTTIIFSQSCSNITFQQCSVLGTYLFNVSGSPTVTNLAFLNCFFNPQVFLYTGNFSVSGLLNNCVFVSGSSFDLGVGAWQVSNCISQVPFTGTNVVYNNNIGTSTQFPAGNGNQQNKTWASIFTLTGSYDGKYTLKVGSPAIGAGINGVTPTDCGIFGGATPYRLSGIPSVPTIYALTSPQGTIPAGNTVQVNLSTRSNN
ncbi:MAG: hypothetical protein ABIX01_16605 [Chitinophagaceae bacterium]